MYKGLGWVALEEVKWGDAAHKWIKPGNLLTCGPGNYKIPSINDIPFNLKVSLLKVYKKHTPKALLLYLQVKKLTQDVFSIRGIQTQRGYIRQKQFGEPSFSMQ